MLQVEVISVNGVPTVARRAHGDAARRLQLTADRLASAAHPGVVEVLSSTGDDGTWELHLAHAGRPLDSLGPMNPLDVARLTAGIAQTLADLHDSGVVHGRLDASHVLVAVDGRPVLCGFGPDDGGRSPADDVAAVGALIVELLGREPDLEPIPEHRWRRRSSWSGWQRRSLLLLADQATAEPETRRPTARRLAVAISEAIPDSVSRPVGRPPAESPPLVDRAGAQRPYGPAAALVGAALVAVGLFNAVRSDGHQPVAPRPGGSEVPEAVAPAEPTTQVEGNIVSVGERRYEVGEPGDVVVVGDWDCDGTDTPALLRPSTGGLFVFGQWAQSAPIEVTPVRVVRGAVGIRGVEDPQGCDRLLVRRDDGSEAAVAPEARA